MSGISRSFKVPSLSLKRRKSSHGLPVFNWKKVNCVDELGVGEFGSVHLANYVSEMENKKVVIKKLRGEADQAKCRFIKEAEMLQSAKHPNIPRFLGLSDVPYGIMIEYVAFDFSPFGVKKTVNCLEDFYHYIDCEFDFKSFSDVLPVCIKDIVTGLEFFHRMEIAHRDLKLGNVLVSNQHYCNVGESCFGKEYERCPIICKIADFGLSRSQDTQTVSVLQSRTNDICRGTPVYMAPEI